jgi:uncharacterized protein DUF1801
MPGSQKHGQFADILAIASPALRSVCQQLRETIGQLHRQYVELVWPRQRIASFGVGAKKMTEHYAYIHVHGAHVNLGFYHGASLPDPDGLLEGTGKRLRHVKLKDLASARSGAVRNLLRAAIAERERARGAKA